MSEAQTIQWFPGHMTKTRRKIQTSLKLVDAVAEIIDARIPVSSRNPELHKIIENKPRIILMNKCDMADPSQTARWVSCYQKEGILAIPVDCKSGRGLNQFIPKVRELLKDRIIQWEQRDGEPDHPGDDRGDSQRGEELFHQSHGKAEPGQGGGPAWRYQRQSMVHHWQGL